MIVSPHQSDTHQKENCHLGWRTCALAKNDYDCDKNNYGCDYDCDKNNYGCNKSSYDWELDGDMSVSNQNPVF